MAKFALHKVYFAPGVDVVTIAVIAEDGPFKGQIKDLYTSQSALAKRARSDTWGDDDVLKEARALLKDLDSELVVPESTLS